MRLLIATDGVLPVDPTTEHAERLYRPGDTVIVMTAINLPRRLLNQLAAVTTAGGAAIEEIVEAAGPGHVGLAGGDRIAERLIRSSGEAPLVEDFVARYRAELATVRTAPLVEALAGVGIEAETLVRETEEKTAATIMDTCRERRIDLLAFGTTGKGRFEGFVGSTGTKLFRHAPCDVLLIRVPPEAGVQQQM